MGQLPGRFASQRLPSPRATAISRAVTCAPLHECHVVEVGVPGQSRLHDVFGEVQLLKVTKDRGVSCWRLLSDCPALREEQQQKGDTGLLSPGQQRWPVAPPNTYRVVLMGNCHPLHQARDNLCREEVVAVAGDRDNAML